MGNFSKNYNFIFIVSIKKPCRTVFQVFHRKNLPRIKVGQLPKAACYKKECKTLYIYPPEFMRHLNVVCFLLATDRKSDPFAAAVRVLINAEYRDDVLLDKHDQECYSAYDCGFLHVIYIGIDRIRDGVYNE